MIENASTIHSQTSYLDLNRFNFDGTIKYCTQSISIKYSCGKMQHSPNGHKNVPFEKNLGAVLMIVFINSL